MKKFLVALTISVLTTALVSAQDVIVIENDLSKVEIALQGAYPISWSVLSMGGSVEYIPLINSDIPGGPFRIILDGEDGPLTQFANTTVYTKHAEYDIYTSGIHESGLQIDKWFEIDGYTAIVGVELRNESSTDPIKLVNPSVTIGPGIGRTPGSVGGLGDAMYSYVDAVAYDGDVHQLSVGDDHQAVWAGIHDRYYALLVAVARPIDSNLFNPRFPTLVIGVDDATDDGFNPLLRIGFPGGTTIQPEERRTLEFKVYAGPKDRTALTEAGYDALLYSNLPGPLRWLCLVLGDLLRFMHSHIGSWWMTIVAFTVLIRIVLFPLAQKTINMNAKMMADQAKLKPLIDEIKLKHKSAQTQYDMTMALYKEHGINPFAPLWGCLPVLLQLPILIAIFNILGQEVTLQGARFLWIDDLSLPDRLFPLGTTLPYFGAYFNLLPILMATVMVLTTNLGSPADGAQKKSQMRSMTFLAFVFFALFYSFPAGLVLYWMLSNLGQYAQQVITNRLATRRRLAFGSEG